MPFLWGGIVPVVQVRLPIIVKSIEERKEYIDTSLQEAQQARSETLKLKKESSQIIEAAQAQRWKILENVRLEQEQLSAQLKAKAEQEAASIIENAKAEGQAQKEEIIRQAHAHVVTLSVAVAEKMLRQQLKGEQAQVELAERILKEMNS